MNIDWTSYKQKKKIEMKFKEISVNDGLILIDHMIDTIDNDILKKNINFILNGILNNKKKYAFELLEYIVKKMDLQYKYESSVLKNKKSFTDLNLLFRENDRKIFALYYCEDWLIIRKLINYKNYCLLEYFLNKENNVKIHEAIVFAMTDEELCFNKDMYINSLKFLKEKNSNEQFMMTIDKLFLYNFKKSKKETCNERTKIINEYIKDRKNNIFVNKLKHTPLMISTDQQKIKKLLKEGFDPNIKNTSGENAFNFHCRKSNNINSLKIILNLLKQYGVNIYEKDNNGTTALMKICERNKIDDFIKELFNNGDNKQYVNMKNKNGDTALFLLLKNSCIFAMNILPLIEIGADVNITDKYGNSAIHYIYYVNSPSVHAIINNINDINIQNKDGETVLHCLFTRPSFYNIVRFSQMHIITHYRYITQVILNNGYDVNIKDKNNKTAFYYLKNQCKYIKLKKNIDTMFKYNNNKNYEITKLNKIIDEFIELFE